jgi:diadenosine tetraphosphate (Ap4A) HIT family hydrolase
LNDCPYCSVSPDDVWFVNELAAAAPCPNPLTTYHMLVVPRRHVSAFYDLDVQEQRAVWSLVTAIQQRARASLQVEGFHVGFADGDYETDFHAHLHVVPRLPGVKLELPKGVQWVDPDGR